MKVSTRLMFYPWVVIDSVYKMLPVAKELHKLKIVMFDFIEDVSILFCFFFHITLY